MVIVMHILITIWQQGGLWIWISVTSCAPHGSLSSVTCNKPAKSVQHKDFTQRKLLCRLTGLQHIHIKLHTQKAPPECPGFICIIRMCWKCVCVCGTMKLPLINCETPETLYQCSAGWKIQKPLFIRDKMSLAQTGWGFWLSSQGHPHFEVGTFRPQSGDISGAR